MHRNRIVSALIVALVAVVAVGCGGDDGKTTADVGEATSVPFDRAFIDAMVPHHESAIEMARAAFAAGVWQTELIAVARDIVDTQQLEIYDMKSWRKQWFGSSTIDPAGDTALGLSDEMMGMTHGPAEIRNADDVNQAFAVAMIPHHKGAITMAKLALDRAEHEETRMLAEEIIRAQEREIEILEPHARGHHGS